MFLEEEVGKARLDSGRRLRRLVVVLDGLSILCRLRALEGSASLAIDSSPVPAPLLSVLLLLLPASSSDLGRVAGMRLRSACSCTDGVLSVEGRLGLDSSGDWVLAFAAGLCGGSESLVGCERVEESMVATIMIMQGQL